METIMLSWHEIEAMADENGFLPEAVYSRHIHQFPVCPPPDSHRKKKEARVWRIYLSSRRHWPKKNSMYQELYRYEWYEGRKRSGFWGNIEKALRLLEPGPAPVISILSAGTGRDLIKVGLAAGIFESIAPPKIKNTHREIDSRYLRLAKPGARIMVTEFDPDNLAALQRTIDTLIRTGALNNEMIALRQWNFRQAAPLASDSQNIIVFALTGNYATIDEQPMILREIARCVKPGGYLIASTMTEKLDFNKSSSILFKLQVILGSPLMMPIAVDFIPWQIRWAKMAAEMNNRGYWRNLPAETWMEFLQPAKMKKIAIYPGPSSYLPVEVLVAQRK